VSWVPSGLLQALLADHRHDGSLVHEHHVLALVLGLDGGQFGLQAADDSLVDG
jgi:hypothetical protein